MLNFELARVAIALACTAYLAWQDYRTSFMNEKLLYAMVGAGLLLDLASIDLPLIAASFVGCAIIFGIGYYYYRKGEIGGGDVLLLCGIHALLPVTPSTIIGWANGVLGLPLDSVSSAVYSSFVNAIPFAVSVLVTATLLGLVGTAVHYGRKLWGRRLQPDWTAGTLALLAAVLVFGSSVFYFGIRPVPSIIYVAAFAPAVFLTAFRKQIERDAVVVRTPLNKILDEDVLLTEQMDPEIVKKYALQRVVTASELGKLRTVARKEKLRAFPIARDLPRFGPYMLAGLLLSLLFGNVVVLMMLLR